MYLKLFNYNVYVLLMILIACVTVASDFFAY